MTAPTTREELEQFLADQIRPIEDGEEGWIDAAKRILAALDDRMVEAARDVLTEHGCGPVSDETVRAAISAAMTAAGE